MALPWDKAQFIAVTDFELTFMILIPCITVPHDAAIFCTQKFIGVCACMRVCMCDVCQSSLNHRPIQLPRSLSVS